MADFEFFCPTGDHHWEYANLQGAIQRCLHCGITRNITPTLPPAEPPKPHPWDAEVQLSKVLQHQQAVINALQQPNSIAPISNRITGSGRIPPYAERPDLVEIPTINALPSLELGKGLFFAHAAIDELAASQDVRPLKSAAEIATGLPEEEDLDSMLQEIYNSRG